MRFRIERLGIKSPLNTVLARSLTALLRRNVYTTYYV